MRISTIGLRRLISQGIINTNANAQTAATSTMKDEANQSSSSPRSSTISSAPRKVATSTKPTRSNPPCSCSRFRWSVRLVDVGRIAAIIANAITPTGPLISKHSSASRDTSRRDESGISHKIRRNESISNAIFESRQKCFDGFGDLEKIAVQNGAAGTSVTKDE
jgi:hypothetical protein